MLPIYSYPFMSVIGMGDNYNATNVAQTYLSVFSFCIPPFTAYKSWNFC